MDATLEEESCVDAKLRIGVNKSGRICYLQKFGLGGLYPELTFEMVEVWLILSNKAFDKLLLTTKFVDCQLKDQKYKTNITNYGVLVVFCNDVRDDLNQRIS